MSAHGYDVDRDTLRRDHFNVLCSCGYRSGPWPRCADAERDADEHVLGCAVGDEPEGAHRTEVVK
jgi:hypothetical protein